MVWKCLASLINCSAIVEKSTAGGKRYMYVVVHFILHKKYAILTFGKKVLVIKAHKSRSDMFFCVLWFYSRVQDWSVLSILHTCAMISSWLFIIKIQWRCLTGAFNWNLSYKFGHKTTSVYKKDIPQREKKRIVLVVGA